MKKLFASVPMRGRTEEEIRESFAKMKRIAEAYEGEELELIDTWIAEDPPEGVRENAVWYLGKSLELLMYTSVWAHMDISQDAASKRKLRSCTKSSIIMLMQRTSSRTGMSLCRD